MTLEFSLNQAAPATVATDCVVVGAYADGSLTPAGQAIDAASGGRPATLHARADLGGTTGKATTLHALSGVADARVLVVGLGEAAKFGVPQYPKAVGDAARTLREGPVASALFTLSEIPVPGRDAAWNIRQAAIAADHAWYHYSATLGAKNPKRERKGLVSLDRKSTRPNS